jgi:hypothetical protein
MVTTIRDDRMAMFTKLQDPATQPEFWARVADNVDWTVKGTVAYTILRNEAVPAGGGHLRTAKPEAFSLAAQRLW